MVFFVHFQGCRMQNDKKEDLETSCGVSRSGHKNVFVPTHKD